MRKKTLMGAVAGTVAVAGAATLILLPSGGESTVAAPNSFGAVSAPNITPHTGKSEADNVPAAGVAASAKKNVKDGSREATAETALSPAAGEIRPAAPSIPMLPAHPDATAPAEPEQPAEICAPGDETVSEGVQECHFASASMGRDVKVEVLPAKKPNAPILYLLDGLITFNENNAWLTQSADLASINNGDVNLVGVVAPSASFYTNWVGPQFGQVANWETFLMDELPGELQKQFQADPNTLGTMGMSMGGFAATNLAARHPDKVDAVYSLSGYYDFTDPLVAPSVMKALSAQNPEIEQNMWGPYQQNKELWQSNMPRLNAENLTMPMRVFTAGGGRPIDAPMDNLIDAWVTRSPMETASMIQTNQFMTALRQSGNEGNVQRVHETIGAHEWHTWKKDAHNGGFQWIVDRLVEAQSDNN